LEDCLLSQLLKPKARHMQNAIEAKKKVFFFIVFVI